MNEHFLESKCGAMPGIAQYSGEKSRRLSIIVPTFNERANIRPFIDLINQTLGEVGWEIIFVDDNSPDLTWKLVRSIAARDRRIRCIRRIGRRGLASAVIEGMLAASSPIIVTMDGDLQHDEHILPDMVTLIEEGKADIVVGSRYIEQGSAGGLSDHRREMLSDFGGRLASAALGIKIKDPMSGFFAVRATALDDIVPKLSGKGFKILVDLLACAPKTLRIIEIPFTFRQRHSGESKLDTAVMLEFLFLLIDRSVGRIVPTRFILFSAIGSVGILVHLIALSLIYGLAGMAFFPSQIIAAFVAMTNNFYLNNIITHRESRLRGRSSFYGLLSFYAICSVGLVTNVGAASVLFGRGETWWVSGALGAAAGAVWNYAMSALYTWRPQRG